MRVFLSRYNELGAHHQKTIFSRLRYLKFEEENRKTLEDHRGNIEAAVILLQDSHFDDQGTFKEILREHYQPTKE